MLGNFDYEPISKSVLRLLSTVRTRVRIMITVWHQYAHIVMDLRLRSSGGNNTKFYVKMIDNFYVIVRGRRRARCNLMVSYLKIKYYIQRIQTQSRAEQAEPN